MDYHQILFSVFHGMIIIAYYERNDGSGARVRICDNNTARSGYRGYYARMTDDIGFVFGGIVTVAGLELPASLVLEQTDVEEEQCIMCYSNKKNLRFLPCAHLIMCSVCYNMLQKKKECPVCKGNIQSLGV